MSDNDNKTLVSQYFDAVSGRSDVDMTTFFAEDICWHLPPAHPMGGPFQGRQAVLAMLSDAASDMFDFASLQVDIQCLLAEGENVMAQFQLEANLQSGRLYRNQYCFRFRCRDGAIVEVWELLDTYYQYQLGMFDHWLEPEQGHELLDFSDSD